MVLLQEKACDYCVLRVTFFSLLVWQEGDDVRVPALCSARLLSGWGHQQADNSWWNNYHHYGPRVGGYQLLYNHCCYSNGEQG
jgi:hypothetical protein